MSCQCMVLSGKPGFIKPLSAVVYEGSKTCELPLKVLAELHVCPDKGQLATLTYSKQRVRVWITGGYSIGPAYGVTEEYRTVCTHKPLHLLEGQQVKLVPFSRTTLIKRGREVLGQEKIVNADLWELLTILCSLSPHQEHKSVVQFGGAVATAFNIKADANEHNRIILKLHALYEKKRKKRQ